MGFGRDPSINGFLLQDAQTTGNGTPLDVRNSGPEMGFYLIWSAGVNAGVVTIETADTSAYSGTWFPISVANFLDGSTGYVGIEGVFHYIRARISTNVTGGTVTVKLFAN